jgi:serine/threonine protein kinase
MLNWRVAQSHHPSSQTQQEVHVMTALRHPNVVLFMAACTKPPQMCIVMELMSLGSLYDVRSSNLYRSLYRSLPN